MTHTDVGDDFKYEISVYATDFSFPAKSLQDVNTCLYNSDNNDDIKTGITPLSLSTTEK